MLIVNEYTSINRYLINKWDNLWKQSFNKTFFNSFNWFNICLQTFKYQQYLIITVEDNNQLVAILPLVKSKHFFVSPGDQYLDNTTFLIRNNNEEVISSIINYIKENKYEVILTEVNELLSRNFKSVLKELASNNPFANLKKSIENIVKHKELEYIKNIREKNKEHIKFLIYKGVECYNQLDRIFEIENASSKPKLKKDIFRNQNARILFKKISKTENPLLIILTYDNLDIAHLFSLTYDKTVMAYHMAYNKDYSYLQPGKLIIIKLMEYMYRNNLQTLDFSRGDSTLKRHFSNDAVQKYNIYINCNIFIALKVLIRKLKKKIKKNRI